MLEKADDLKRYELHALDGEIGSVEEFYFDDKHWTVRYLVAETGSWLTGKDVLISPFAITSVDRDKKIIHVNLTKKQIEDSPDRDSHRPVSRPFEESYNAYYGWPSYWGGPYAWGNYPFAGTALGHWDRSRAKAESEDRNLRSTKDDAGHNVEATDGEIGHVEDFVIDCDSWTIRYLVVDTSNWWVGKKVLISSRWIESIDWLEGKIDIGMTREAIRNSPDFSEKALQERDYEAILHKHYNRQDDWSNDFLAK
ncbi:MAG: PRC-barrel domain-containing protein [Fibrobacteres bacterium]|nr:PRC-barrel domain-containing protein [Fibrobacterota bacterium]